MIPSYRRHVALIYGASGPFLEFYPPTDEVVRYGWPSAHPTFSVWRGEDGNDSTAQFSGTAVLDSTSTTTTDAAAGPSQARRNRLPLTSTTGFGAGKRYLVSTPTTSGRRRLVVTCVAVATDDYIDLAEDLTIEVPSGSTVAHLRCIAAVDATFIATATNINVFGSRVSVSAGASGSTQTSAPPYRVRWSYLGSDDSIPRQTWTTFDVCRAPAKHSVTKAELLELMPDVVFDEWKAQRGQDFQPQIRAAWDRVRWDIRMAGYDVDMLSQDTEVLDRLTLLAARAQLAQLGCRPRDRDANDYATECENAYKNAVNDSVTVTLKAWAQTDASGAIAIETNQQLWLQR
jgi:hypothetical protein